MLGHVTSRIAAAAFLVKDNSGAVLGTALVVNNATAGFAANDDALVFLQGYTVDATNTIRVI